MILLAKSPGYIAVHTNAGNLVAIVPIETEKLSGTILKDATVGAHSSDRCGAFLISPAVSRLGPAPDPDPRSQAPDCRPPTGLTAPRSTWVVTGNAEQSDRAAQGR